MTVDEKLSDLVDFAESLNFGDLHIKFDPKTGLRAIVAIHSTKNGPALGGCRCLEYASPEAAINDALRLSNAMSKKAAIVNLPLGGGKAVLLKPKHIPDRKAYFEAYGRFVEELNGRYITAVDSGTDLNDMDVIATQTKYVAGTTEDDGAPSPFTAQGVVRGIEAAIKFKYGRESLSGLHVAIQGVGHVGYYLAKYLHERGATLTVADMDADALHRCETEFGASTTTTDKIYSIDCDVFAPCALGAAINHDTLPLIKAKIIAGAANNQLQDPSFGEKCHKLDILYAPDFVINSGGLIYAAGHYLQTPDSAIGDKISNIYYALLDVFKRADQENQATNAIANTMALEKL